MPTPAQTPRRKALNTLVQGLAVACASALVVVALAAVSTAKSYTDLGALLIGYSTFQAVATAGLTWLMRGYVDRRRALSADPAHMED